MSAPSPSETFRLEAQELLDLLEQLLLDLEQRPDNGELVDGAFRALHTIKGSGAMFGFDRVATFTHGFETAFDRVRKGQVPPSRDLVAVALAAKDHIRTLIERPDEASADEGEAILGALRKVVDPAAASEGAIAASHPTGADPDTTLDAKVGARGAPDARTAEDGAVTWSIRFRLARNAVLLGTNPFLLLDELRALGDCAVSVRTDGVPPLDEMEPEACHLGWDVVLTTCQPRSAIEDVFMFVADDAELAIDRMVWDAPRDDAPRDDAPATAASPSGGSPHSDTLMAVAQALMAFPGEPRESASAGDAGKPATTDRPANRPPERPPERPARATTEPTPDQGRDASREGGRTTGSLRVQAERLDELMDRVGELVIAQARLTQIAVASADLNIKAVAEELERLASGLRDITMGIRMVPIGSLFGRFRRLVHDLSRDLGKQVELSTAGEETELDKTMIERLGDPLVHLIRNAIDHGLEPPEGRAAAGKPGPCSIRLVARHVGAEVHVSVSDDGRGLDVERIRAKAEEQGLLSPGDKPSDAELYQFLFHPGFSTAATITSVSGRGVGMDVVKRAIEALRGSIDIATTPGRGTTVTLRLPLTLAIVDGLLVRVGAGRFAIPLSAVEECVELSVEDDLRSKGRSFLNIRDALVPFLRLRELFGVSAPPDPFQKIVIVSSGELRVGLVVDQIIGNHQTVIKSLSKLHADVETFSGATILGDGTVALILDVAHLVEFGQAREERLKAS